MCTISILIVKDHDVIIQYPFRFFKRTTIIKIHNINKIRFSKQNGKAAPEFIRFYVKDQSHKLYLESWRNYYVMLHFFESKGIIVEVRGTENNSINDLK